MREGVGPDVEVDLDRELAAGLNGCKLVRVDGTMPLVSAMHT